jgi:hypothetical protein
MKYAIVFLMMCATLSAKDDILKGYPEDWIEPGDQGSIIVNPDIYDCPLYNLDGHMWIPRVLQHSPDCPCQSMPL